MTIAVNRPDGITKIVSVIDTRHPLEVARAFLERGPRPGLSGDRLLSHWQDAFYRWDSEANCWRELDADGIRAEVYHFLEGCYELGPADHEGQRSKRPVRPKRTLVAEVIDALKAETLVSGDVNPPAWIDSDDTRPASSLLAFKGGLLDMATNEIEPPNLALFNLSAVPFAYDPDAHEAPVWRSFLSALWPDDPESISTLHAWMGYCLTADTSQQKGLLLIGPKRSGKGTIARVLTKLVGEANMVGPSLGSLAQNFGLWPWIGKSLAIIADARLTGRTDQGPIVERLLSIIGEDLLTIDRKHTRPWSGRLPTRIMILSNELPRLPDASGAVSSRFILLQLRRSFLGCEDHELEQKLQPELPAILNLALSGLANLRAIGRFTQPASAARTIRDFEAATSPMSVFRRERLVEGPEHSATAAELYGEWRSWCSDNGREPGTLQNFAISLRAAIPALDDGIRKLEDGERATTYCGVALRPRPGRST